MVKIKCTSKNIKDLVLDSVEKLSNLVHKRHKRKMQSGNLGEGINYKFWERTSYLYI